ncbi:hypothetical protein [Haloarcula salina]|uniref:Uncharacterized protein n=1 Tax=Haloarcula salina TaxID=1429914 RepID=A0AA41G187_9EURY|nr:hypothetical protein [Haloarcula salina]MBV0901729.1 hypothetical protein [Haloarcula salina]
MPSHGSRSLPLLLSVLLVGSLLALAAPVGAAPPPRPLCDACGDQFATTAERHGVSLAVERSTATVAVHENGTATWVVRNHLAGDGARLRSNATLRRAIGDRAMWDVEFLNATVSRSGVVTLRYREPDFAEPAIGGTFRSGAFTETYGYRNIDGLGADRLVVVAPPGTRVGRPLPDSTVSSDGRQMHITSFDRGGIVTFVPQESAVGPLLSLLAVVTMRGPAVLGNLLTNVAVPAAAFGVLVGAVGGGLSTIRHRLATGARGAGCALAGIGLLVALAPLVAGGLSVLSSSVAPLLGVGIAFVALGLGLSRTGPEWVRSFPALVGVAVGGLAVAVLATAVGTLAVGIRGLTLAMWTSARFLVPVFALLPAGYAVGAGRRRLGVATAVLGFVLALAPTATLYSPFYGFGVLVFVFVLGMAAGVVALGAPLFGVGFVLATTRPSDEAENDAARGEQ